MMVEEFGALFEEYMAQKRDEMKEKYNRVLPSGELIFNRFDKGKYLKCGEESSVYDTAVIMGDVEIGSHVWVGPYTLLEGSNAKLVIGDYVSIDSGVMIYTHDSTKFYLSGGTENFIKGDVTIHDYTVIGTMTMVSCNVSIGEHCVIGANSFVNHDIPDYSIAFGTPAKVVGTVVFDERGKVEFRYFESGEEKCFL